MKTKIQTPIRFSGLLYFVDDIELNDKINFTKELTKAKNEDNEPWILECCSIIQHEKFQGEKLIFDINQKDCYECYFIGFLYDNGKALGKIKWSRDISHPDEIINGYYKKINRNKIILCGVWEADRRKDNFISELITIK